MKASHNTVYNMKYKDRNRFSAPPGIQPVSGLTSLCRPHNGSLSLFAVHFKLALAATAASCLSYSCYLQATYHLHLPFSCSRLLVSHCSHLTASLRP